MIAGIEMVKDNGGYLRRNWSVLKRLPVIGEVKKHKVPELMKHDEGIKGCVRMAMVAESIRRS